MRRPRFAFSYGVAPAARAGRGRGDPPRTRAADHVRRRGSRGVVGDPATGGLTVVPVPDENRDQILVHEAHSAAPTTAFALPRPAGPDALHHTPIGVLCSAEHPVYDTQMADQPDTAIEQNGKGGLSALRAGATPGPSPADTGPRHTAGTPSLSCRDSELVRETPGSRGRRSPGCCHQTASGQGVCGPGIRWEPTLPKVRARSISDSSTAASRRTPSRIRSGVG